jgi:hypothetical protein
MALAVDVEIILQRGKRSETLFVLACEVTGRYV